MAPREGNSVVRHGVVDERLNVHGVKGLKVCDLSICPDNVGCNTFSVSTIFSSGDINRLLTRWPTTDCSAHRREVLCPRCRGSGLLWCCPGHEGAYLPRTWRDREPGSPVNEFRSELYLVLAVVCLTLLNDEHDCHEI